METHCISPKRSGVAGRRVGACFIALVLLLCVGGCVKQTTEGTTQTFAYELWVPLSVLLAGVLAAAAGWKLRDTSARVGWGLVVFGPCAVLLLAPSLLREQVVVDGAGLYVRSGIWGLTAVREVRYEDLQLVRFTSEQVRSGRVGTRTQFCFICEPKSGKNVKIPMNNDVKEAASPHFVEMLLERGVPVVDET